ncbi:peptidase M23B [Alkaliphilus metalliredigens QYMF]|uniref:Peptidase M23B n=1 Tax=Alkaliphilus metalliredigens (strain QYMF) TaxID=293826 RepID=A6TK72_ALKMQ|nr:M23 family metallopeptidase [Alkaliphilus metalliredigens]ABR46590.1 peptidase M23B [Alkaliphilus metalliredigens QYMF]
MSNENNNKNNNDKKKDKKTLYQFLDKEGFYIILFLCVCIVAVTAIWVSNQSGDDFISEAPEDRGPDVTLVEGDGEEQEQEEDSRETAIVGESEEEGEPSEETSQNTEKLEEQEQIQEQESEKPIVEATPKQEEKPKTQEIIEDKDAKEEVAPTASSAQDMALPVVGKLGMSFADDRLVYHRTLEQWATHHGIDLHAEEGAPVKTVLTGEVVEVLNDSIIGITVTIDHGDGLMTRYSNLSTDAMVNVGDHVEKGKTISGVGKTSVNKREEGALLHFQVLKDNKPVDPQAYLPKLN